MLACIYVGEDVGETSVDFENGFLIKLSFKNKPTQLIYIPFISMKGN